MTHPTFHALSLSSSAWQALYLTRAREEEKSSLQLAILWLRRPDKPPVVVTTLPADIQAEAQLFQLKKDLEPLLFPGEGLEVQTHEIPWPDF